MLDPDRTRAAGGRAAQVPRCSQAPGIYRFRIRGSKGKALYVGETENLARRFGFYRNPGPSQQTNVRMNAKFREALASAWVRSRIRPRSNSASAPNM